MSKALLRQKQVIGLRALSTSRPLWKPASIETDDIEHQIRAASEQLVKLRQARALQQKMKKQSNSEESKLDDFMQIMLQQQFKAGAEGGRAQDLTSLASMGNPMLG